MTPPKIALIHGTSAAVAPAVAGISSEFPDAVVWNLLDDLLLPDADAAGGVTVALDARMRRLIAHARADDADAVLLTCSMYGAVAAAVATEIADTDAAIPVLAPDEAAFRIVVRSDWARVLVVASFTAAAEDSAARLSAALASAGREVSVRQTVADGAMAATRAGDDDALTDALHAAVSACLADADAVVLAQYSLAPAAARLAALIGRPVVSGPQAAAALLRERLA